jgi:hypothetical protein
MHERHPRVALFFRLAIIQLGANVVQPGGVDAVRLPVHGSDQLFGAEFFKDAKRAVAQHQPFTGVALNGSDAARAVADVHYTSTFGENV